MEEDRAISLNAAIDAIYEYWSGIQCVDDSGYGVSEECEEVLRQLPPVTSKTLGMCKDCKYFEYDGMAKVDGIPLIVAHEICNKWGDGCKTQEDGYCFLFERREEGEEE